MKKKLLENFRELLLQKNRTATIEKKERDLNQFFRWFENRGIAPLEISYTEVLDYINACSARGVTKSTINQYIGTISEFYRFLYREGKRKDNPAENLHIRGEIKRLSGDMLSREELDKLYTDFLSNGLRHKRNRCMLGLLVYQGITTAELMRLQVNDVKLFEGTVYIPSVARSNSRTLKLEALQAIHLQSYLLSVRPALLARYNRPTDKLFFTSSSKGSMFGAVCSLLKQTKLRENKLKRLHQLRSSVIAHWLKMYHIREVQYMAGHRNVSSTERYKTGRLESLQEQLEKIHPLQ